MTLALRITGRIALSLGVAALFLVPLCAWGGVDLASMGAALTRLSWPVYLASLGLHVALYVLRAIRFRILMPPAQRPAHAPFLAVCSAHTLAAFLLPAKIGEATFVLYANRVCGLSSSTGIAALVVARILDLATVTGGLATACFVLHLTGAHPDIAWFQAIGVILSAVAASLFALSARGDLVVRCAAAITRFLGLGRFALGRRVLGAAAEISAALRVAGGEGRLLAASLVSVPIWLSVFLFCAVLARGLGLPAETTLAQATFGSSLAILTSQIPVSAFASFGTLEAGWVLGFGVLGVPRDVATTTGVGLHLVQLANVIALGLVGHVAMGAFKKR